MTTFYFKNKRDERFKFELSDEIPDQKEMDEWLDTINTHEAITEQDYKETLNDETRIDVYSEVTDSNVGYLYHDRSLLPDDFEL